MEEFIGKLEKLESLLVVLLAVSLPLGLTFSWIVLIAGIVVFVARILIEWKTTGKITDNFLLFLSAPFSVPLLVLCAAIFLSGVVSGGFVEGLKCLEMLRVFIVYFWAYQVFATRPHLVFRALEWLLLVGAVAGLWGTIQQLFAFHPNNYPYLQGTGFHGGPMAFAGQMEILSLISLALALKTKKEGGQFSVWFLKAPIFQIIVLLNILGVVFASERSAWLGVILAAVTVSAIVSPRASLALVASLIVAGGIAWFTVPVFQKRLTPLSDPKKDIGVRVRLQVWDEAIKQFQKSPITGVGFRKFPLLDIPEAIVPGKSKYLDHAHNNYLHILSTTGVVGFACFVWLHFSILLCAWRRYLGQGDDCAVALGILGSVVSLIVAGFFEYNFGTSQVRFLEWFVLAMLPPGNSAPSEPDLHPAPGMETPGGEKAHDGD